MPPLNLNIKPSLIACIQDNKLTESILELIDETEFTTAYLSTFENLFSDIEQRNSKTLIIEFVGYSDDNLNLISDIKSQFPNIDIIAINYLRKETERARVYRTLILSYGATDYVLYPAETKYLEIQLNNSYRRQKYILEINTKLEFENSLNMAEKEILSEFEMKSLYKKAAIHTLQLTKSDFCSISIVEKGKIKEIFGWDGQNWEEQSNPDIKTIKNLNVNWKNKRVITLNPDELKKSVNFPIHFSFSNITSYMNSPIVDGKNIIGIIETYKTHGEYEEPVHSEILKSFAKTASLATAKLNLNNTQIIEHIEKESPKEDDPSAIFENIPYISFIIQNSKLKFINKEGIEKLGYDRKELKDSKIGKIISNESKKILLDSINEIKATQSNGGKIAINLKKSNGEVLPSEMFISIINFSNKKAFLFIGNENQNKAQLDTKDSSEVLRLAEAVNSLKSAVTITDMDREIIYVNPAHKSTFGYEPQELIGNQNSILYSIDDPSGISKKIYDAILTVGWEGEKISVRKNGEVFPAYEKISVVKNQDGQSIGIVSVLDEITQRKRLEQALRESEERYRTLVETATTAIIATDENGNIILYNPSAEKIFEYSKEEALEKKFSSLISEKSRKNFANGSDETNLSEFIGKTLELYGLNKSGEEFPTEMTFSSCIIEGKKVYTTIILDITERKNLQDQLIQSAKLAAVGELISGVTHEVNNPLAIVMGYAEMMLTEPNFDDEIQKTIKVIYDESNRARKVIQNMLSFARQHTPEKEPTMLNDIIEKTLDLASYDLKKNGIEVIRNYDSSLPHIMAEPNQLQQVFLNIIINAQHAISEKNPKGTITITTGLKTSEDSEKENDFVEIIISDDGPGIPKKIRENIFAAFFTTKPVGKGTGLGLSVSMGIIREHNGKIHVRSTEGEGTDFHIELPIDPEVYNKLN